MQQPELTYVEINFLATLSVEPFYCILARINQTTDKTNITVKPNLHLNQESFY